MTSPSSPRQPEEKTHATTISHTSSSHGATITTTTTITTTITTKQTHRNNSNPHSYTFCSLITNNDEEIEFENDLKIKNKSISAYIGNGQYEKAKAAMENIDIPTDENKALHHFHYACICDKLCLNNLAIKHLKLAVTENPNDAHWRLYYAQILYKMNHLKECEAQHLKCIKLQPTNPRYACRLTHNLKL